MRHVFFSLCSLAGHLAVLAYCGISLAEADSTQRSERPPNVIMILTDDQGYGDLECHGHPFLKTPHLDTFHETSIRLIDFHVMPLCAPTRAALMTGRNPMRDGIWATVLGRSILPAKTPTLADVFAKNGYRTGIFGKWHLGDNAPARPQDKGFRHVMTHGGGGVGQTPDYWGNDYLDDVYVLNNEPIATRGYCTDVWFAAATHFIRANRDKPFFAYIATNAPHAPFVPPPDLAERYMEIPGIDPQTAAFYAMIENIDKNVGKLLETLRETGLDSNTILVFLTDNGTAQGTRAPGAFNAGMRGTKGTLYEGGHRVPCFIRWPGGGLPSQGTGRDVEGLFSGEDLLPTLASLCGLSLAGHTVPIDGLDISAKLKGREMKALSDRHLYIQFAQTDSPPPRGHAAVLTPRWRMINNTELYEIRTDPGQARNVASEHPDIVADLVRKYDEWYDSTAAARNSENRILVGAPQEPITRLNVMDLHTGGTPATLPWNQSMILKGQNVRGYWALEAFEEGEYLISASRWPAESRMAMKEAPEGGKVWPIAKARLRLGTFEGSVEILEKDREAKFEVFLKKGSCRFVLEFSDAEGNDLGSAYYVSVRKKRK